MRREAKVPKILEFFKNYTLKFKTNIEEKIPSEKICMIINWKFKRKNLKKKIRISLILILMVIIKILIQVTLKEIEDLIWKLKKKHKKLEGKTTSEKINIKLFTHLLLPMMWKMKKFINLSNPKINLILTKKNQTLASIRKWIK